MDIQLMGLVHPEMLNRLNIRLDKNETAAFVLYSDFDIPLKFVFKKAKYESSKGWIVGEYQISYVTAEIAIEYPMIPRGHRTVCVIQSKDQTIFKDLPLTTDWDSNSNKLILSE